MYGLRRTEEGPEASQHLGQFSLAHRGVQLLDSGADIAGKTGAAAQSAYDSLTSDEDLSDSGDQAIRDAPRRLNRVGATTKGAGTKSANPKHQGKGGGTAARKPGRGASPNVRGAGGALKGQLRSQNIAAATRNTGKATAQVGTTASRGAITASRVAAAAANFVRAAVAAVTTTLSGSPVALIVAVVIGVVVLIVSVIGWLIPGVQQERDHGGGGNYGIGVPPGPWGGWDNGFIPEELLRPIPWAPSHLLRSDAVDALVALNNDFRAEFGYDIGINDAYRDYAGQVEQRQIWCGRGKCGNAAEPGTSNHGWALAADLGTGISSFGTPQYRWMKEHAPSYGWQHPAWAEPSGAHPEPWHWDFWGWAGAGGGDPSDAKAYAQQALGGDTLQFQCLDRLWTGESNWNPLATNPSSGAYGIPQALPADKLAEAGSDWRTNGVTQVKWGLTYIEDRYGTPCDAWAFWQSKNPHWY